MDKYRVLEQIGSGSYSTVFRALSIQKGNEVVALKRMKGTFKTWEECLRLREIQSLKGMQCPNVIRLLEAVRENEELVLVFEYCEGSLHQAIIAQKSRGKDFSEAQIRGAIQQLLTALDYIHRKGYFHRDIKPENILLNQDGMLKLSDFGLAREIRSRPPFSEYVSTRWYRAPENLMRSSVYNSPSDLWGVGAIMAEMFTRQPLFPGRSETDQLFKICSVCGTPDSSTWPKGIELAQQRGIRFPQVVRTELSKLISNASALAIQFMEAVMQFDPAKRPSAAQALDQDFFKGACEKIHLQVLRPPVGPQSQQQPSSSVIAQQQRPYAAVAAPSNPTQDRNAQSPVRSTSRHGQRSAQTDAQFQERVLRQLDDAAERGRVEANRRKDEKHNSIHSATLNENTMLPNNMRGVGGVGARPLQIDRNGSCSNIDRNERLKAARRITDRLSHIPGVDDIDECGAREGGTSGLASTLADDELADIFWRKATVEPGDHAMSQYSERNISNSGSPSRVSGLHTPADMMDDEAIADLLFKNFNGMPKQPNHQGHLGPNQPIGVATAQDSLETAFPNRGQPHHGAKGDPAGNKMRDESLGNALDELDRFMCNIGSVI